MVLPIVTYGHPTLRRKGARVEEITPEIRQLIADMLETMKDAAGVGLAAQQVDQALQLTVIDVSEVTDRPSTLEVNGQSVPPEQAMPMVLINPEITPEEEPEPGPEGCLSFPEIYIEITRPKATTVRATNLDGEPIEFRCGGLLSRAIQHEFDHLQGILFIDRMSSVDRERLRPELEDMQAATKAALKKAGKIS